MRRKRLKLVDTQNSASTATDDTKELLPVSATPDCVIRRRRLVDAGNEGPPDDAA
jgi:hypothetical protein